MSAGKRVVVVGVGNIGSHLVDFLARSPAIGSLTIIDRDRYEPRNRANQAGVARGRKATVQARRVRHLNPSLDVTSVVGDVERLPAGVLVADLVVSCLDNRRARIQLNQTTRWLGIPWIDTGVLAEGRYARITRIGPEPAAACYLCGWGPRDFELVERQWSCDGSRATAAGGAPSGTGAALGSLAASLAALEVERVLTGMADPGRPEELVISADSWGATATRRVKDPACRADHSRLTTIAGGLAASAALGEAIAVAERRCGSVDSIGVVGARFATRLQCAGRGCSPTPARPGSPFPVRLVRRGQATARCPTCRRSASVLGFGLTDRLAAGGLDQGTLGRSLEAIGCRPRDILLFSSTAMTLSCEVRDVN